MMEIFGLVRRGVGRPVIATISAFSCGGPNRTTAIRDAIVKVRAFDPFGPSARIVRVDDRIAHGIRGHSDRDRSHGALDGSRRSAEPAGVRTRSPARRHGRGGTNPREAGAWSSRGGLESSGTRSLPARL